MWRELDCAGWLADAGVPLLHRSSQLNGLLRSLSRMVAPADGAGVDGAGSAEGSLPVGLVLMDFRLAEADPQAVVERVRALAPQAALLMVDERPFATEPALLAGADEFLLLPLTQPEVGLARVRAALFRRGVLVAKERARRLTAGPCLLDVDHARLECFSIHVSLTEREAEFARCLFESPGQVVTRLRLARLWALDETLAARSIEQHAYQLRRKLKRCAGSHVLLRSIYGQGYRLDCVSPRWSEPFSPSCFRPPLRVMTTA